jgi:glutathione S-transferase
MTPYCQFDAANLLLTAWWQQGVDIKPRSSSQPPTEDVAMITLYNFGPYFGLPEPSPYVMKTEIQLRMAGLAYVKDRSGFMKAPKGKLPYIDDAGEIVADSTFIRAHIERKYGFDFDHGLDKTERAEGWAIERMVEDHLVWAATYMRWCIPENFAIGPSHFFDQLPEAIRDQVRQQALAKTQNAMQCQGTGRHALEEIVTLGTRSLDALSALLGNRPWLMGEQPCGTDATMTGALAMLLTPAIDSPLRRNALGFANLTAYADRAMARFYPDHAWPKIADHPESALAFA